MKFAEMVRGMVERDALRFPALALEMQDEEDREQAEAEEETAAIINERQASYIARTCCT